MVDKAAAVGFRIQRPAYAVSNRSRYAFASFNLPQLLYTYTVDLWVRIGIQFEFRDQLFAEVSAAAFGQNRRWGMNFNTLHVGVFGFAIQTNSHVADDDTTDCAIWHIVDTGSGIAREYVHTQVLCLRRQPGTQGTQ